MPGSVAEGKDLVKEFCIKNNVERVLDVGPGEGTYYFALQGSPVTRLDGVEAWAPYINQFDLRNKYTNLFVSDIYYFDWNKAGQYDMVILGDVLEHLMFSQGREVLEQAANHATWVALSLPIYGYAQGWGHDGNWFEAHLEQYNHEGVLKLLNEMNYEVLETFKGGTVGVYIFTKRPKVETYVA